MADVLVVDSSDICRELLSSVLEGNGYTTAWATPENAMEGIRRSTPALVVLEPGGMGSQGWTVLARLRSGKGGEGQPPGPAIVIVTDQSDKHHVLNAAKLGVRDYMLKKRFVLAELLTRVRRHVAPSKTLARLSEANAPAAPPPPVKASSKPPAKTAAQTPTPLQLLPSAHTAARTTEDRAAVLDAARELGLKLLTREETLELLESASVKTLPGVVAELISLVNSPRGTVSDLALVLRRDPVLTARILRVANSAGFATQRARIGTVEEAVKNIGVAGVRNLVVNVGVFDAFSGNDAGGLRMTRVWQHCLGVAMLMEKMTPQDPSSPPGAAYLVGLCHDLADIVLRQHFAAGYRVIESLVAHCGCGFRLAHALAFGMSYSEVVAQLLARLRLPPLITVPIEEFFERGEKKGAAGAGSLLGRTLRAINVYAHGLLLAPGLDAPITPLTRLECANTFGDAALSPSDELTLRSEALATASILAGLTASQTQQMGEPLVPQRPLRVGYSRHGDYAKLDPLAALLRLTAREVTMLPPLGAIAPRSLADVDALIAAGPRSAAEVMAQDLEAIRRLVAGRPLHVLYTAGFSAPPPAAASPASPPITIQRLPLDIDSLGQFLAKAAAEDPADAVARAA